ncbi:YggS family pyridoxal phosphate-dependent enzyme [Bythopirellula polymerisocia]|uniref:Pyridoxal phosphate homeostasis protein n=1 Tax=Bythopirellula polymerisocia TaxID=2528003 RepID=A0A5C6CAC5_9BACT|nr:YggS family pyridoxal phosphate-dependent enzyme [Bythopirellula polymerisocia]TWU20897.1 Pyridoxal phosphate homeostasis protein [Bythopirellula polymerisocia]
MSLTVQLITDNLARVRERIAEAATSVNRDPGEIQLIGVSKYVGVAETAALLAAGCIDLGESRPQQLWEKAEAQELASARWHLVGHLQRNKVRRTLPVVELIHSVDSWRLLKAIDQCAEELGLTACVLLEVNCTGENAKHGLSADELRRLLPSLPELKHVSARGLMTMAALKGGLAVAENNFAALRELRDESLGECPLGVHLPELSMGMSQDFEAAIRAGATMVRVGSCLFDGVAP